MNTSTERVPIPCKLLYFSFSGDQVDLGYTVSVTGVATQGASDSQDWVRSYQLSYSDDGSSWLSYYETGNFPKVRSFSCILCYNINRGLLSLHTHMKGIEYVIRVQWNLYCQPLNNSQPLTYNSHFANMLFYCIIYFPAQFCLPKYGCCRWLHCNIQ